MASNLVPPDTVNSASGDSDAPKAVQREEEIESAAQDLPPAEDQSAPGQPSMGVRMPNQAVLKHGACFNAEGQKKELVLYDDVLSLGTRAAPLEDGAFRYAR